MLTKTKLYQHDTLSHFEILSSLLNNETVKLDDGHVYNINDPMLGQELEEPRSHTPNSGGEEEGIQKQKDVDEWLMGSNTVGATSDNASTHYTSLNS